jgi:hypothetical protein
MPLIVPPTSTKQPSLPSSSTPATPAPPVAGTPAPAPAGQPSSSGTTQAKTPVQKVKDRLKKLLADAEKFEKRRPELEKTARDKISYAKTKLMQKEPFFAMLLFKMPVD